MAVGEALLKRMLGATVLLSIAGLIWWAATREK